MALLFLAQIIVKDNHGGLTIPSWGYWIIAFATLYSAFFRAWKEIKIERDNLKTEKDIVSVYFVEEVESGHFYNAGLLFHVVNKTERDVYVSSVDLFGISSNGKEEAISYESSTVHRRDFWKSPIASRDSAGIIFHITMSAIRARGYKQIFAVAFLKDDSQIAGDRLGVTPPFEQAPDMEALPPSPV